MQRTDWLDAGGLVGDAADPTRVDRVDARSWRHPGMPDRVVVRLVPESLARGDEAEAILHGFQAAGAIEGVGAQIRRSLGFPGWVLVTDPERARLALDTWKEMRAQRKKIAVKPGAVRDELAAIAGRLNRTVPHFLPTFWEEIGRWFVEAGNPTFGASAFERAREAELAHGLTVDEDRRSEVFLEFALMGALTVKSLSAYGKELQRTLGKEAAAERFLDLVTRRTQGGLAPWANTLKDLAGMATAAKRDPVAFQRGFLADVLGSPAMARAPAKLWTTALALLDAPTDGEKAALCRLWPENLEDAETWIPWLVARGCLDHVDDAPRWLRRAIGFASSQSIPAVELLPVLDRLAERIRVSGAPLTLRDDEYESVDVALLDRALSLGLPVDHDAAVELGLAEWLEAVVAGRGSMLDAVMADPRFAVALDRAVSAMSHDKRFDTAAQTCPPIATLRRRWLEAQIARLTSASIRAAKDAIDELAGSTSPTTWARFPEAEAALHAVDLAVPLARSLRWGLAAELAWPEAEAAAAGLATTKGTRRKTRLSWPWLIVDDGRNAIAVAPDGRRIEHELHVPKGGAVEGIAVVGDVLLVRVQDDNYDAQAYWSTSARQRFECDVSLDGRVATPLAGRFTFGGRPFAPGDQDIDVAAAWSDGTSAWIRDDNGKLRRLADDGTPGPGDPPRFLADVTEDDGLDLVALPRPSPLGGADGVYASVRTGIALRINDGRVIPAVTGEDPPDAMLALPGAEPLRLSTEWAYHDEDSSGGRIPLASSPDGSSILGSVRDDTWGGGLPIRPPLDAWHLAVPRDPPGSAALREIQPGAVADLLTVPDEELEAAVSRAIPAITALPLRAAVVALAQATREGRAALVALEVGTKDEVVETRLGEPTDREIGEAMGGLGEAVWSSEPIYAVIRAAGRFLLAGEDGPFAPSDLPWPRWIDAMPAIAWRAVAPAAEGDADRETRPRLLGLLEALREAGFTAGKGRLRHATFKCEHREHPFLRTVREDGELVVEMPGWTAVEDGSRYWIKTEDDWDEGATLSVLEWRADGEFRTPAGLSVEDEHVPGTPWAGLDAFLTAAAEREEIPLEEDLSRIATGMGVSRGVAAAAASGFRLLTGGGAADLRKRYGLKATDVKLVPEEVGRIQMADRHALLAASIPADPTRLWEPGVAADGLIAAWTARFERVEPLPEDLTQRLAKELGHLSSSVGDLVGILQRGVHAPQLADRFDGEIARDLPTLLAWTHAATPGGDPVRSRLPGILAAALARLSDPETRFEFGEWWDYEGHALDAWWRELGGEPWRADADEASAAPSIRIGGLLATRSDENELQLMVYPAAMQPGDAERAANYASLAGERDLLPSLALLRSPGIAALIAEPLPDGAWPQDPRVTHPQLVQRVVAARGWTADTATVYLQLLGLGAPTKKDLLRWNGWKPRQLDAAVAPLVADGTLVVGKRARAGREWFLPGPWVDLGHPLPMEGWKLPLFGAAGPDALLPLRVTLPNGPYRDLFDAAWARIESGDVPRYG